LTPAVFLLTEEASLASKLLYELSILVILEDPFLSKAVTVILDREEPISTAPAVVAGVALLPIYSDFIQDFIRRFYKEAPYKGLELS